MTKQSEIQMAINKELANITAQVRKLEKIVGADTLRKTGAKKQAAKSESQKREQERALATANATLRAAAFVLARQFGRPENVMTKGLQEALRTELTKGNNPADFRPALERAKATVRSRLLRRAL